MVESGRGRGAERRSGLKARAGVADGLGRGASAIMPAIDLVNLSALLDDAKCFALVRQHRWREGVRCPGCGSDAVIRNGCDDTQPHRQRYRCKACAGRFDDLTGTVLAGHQVDSSGRRNTAYVSCSEELVQSLGRCSPAQGLSRPAVEGDRHGCKVVGAVHAEVGALWKVLAQQPVGVLVRAALPGAMRDRRSRPPRQRRSGAGRAGPSPLPDPRSASVAVVRVRG